MLVPNESNKLQVIIADQNKRTRLNPKKPSQSRWYHLDQIITATTIPLSQKMMIYGSTLQSDNSKQKNASIIKCLALMCHQLGLNLSLVTANYPKRSLRHSVKKYRIPQMVAGALVLINATAAVSTVFPHSCTLLLPN